MTDHRKRSMKNSVDEYTYAKFKLLVLQDQIPYTKLMTELLEGYVRRDPRIVEFIEDYKQTRKKKQSKIRKQRLERRETLAKRNQKLFGLDKSEVMDVYDLIEIPPNSEL